MWCRGSQIFMRVARGSASFFSSHGRGIGPQDALKKDSRGLCRGAAGNPRCPELPAQGLVPLRWGCALPSPNAPGKAPNHIHTTLRWGLGSSLRSPAEGEGHEGFPPPPDKDLESPSSTRLEARFPYHDSRAMTWSLSPRVLLPSLPLLPSPDALFSQPESARVCTESCISKPGAP